MQKLNLPKIFDSVKGITVKHAPEILTGIGIAGMIATTVLAVKATPKALQLIEEEKEKHLDENCEPIDKLTPVETIKATWKCYIPAAVTGVVSTACLIGASSVNLRRNAALVTAYKLSETALADYKEKVVETIGEKKEKTVREKVATEQVKKNPATNAEVIVTGNGNTRFYDPMSGRTFMSNIDKVKSAENELNNVMLHSITGYASLNDFYDELDLSHTDVGDSFGWNTTNLVKMEFYPIIDETDKNPTIVLDYVNRPDYGYDR